MSEHDDFMHRLRHSTSHIMAQAVLERFPEAKLAIGPAIDEGFYYDFDLPRALTPQDLQAIEARMKEIIPQGQAFEYSEVSEEEARRLFADQPYKLELIDDILKLGRDEYGEASDAPPTLSVYRHGSFVDLCRGPHVSNSREINPRAIKLLNIAGAYWRGREDRPMLQRIYGTVFPTSEELDAYLARLAEIERRDHRRLGKELDLYSTHDIGGAGLIYWHPKGAVIRETIENFWREEHRKRGYDIVYSPHIGRVDLWKISGHWDFYRESMYSPIDIDGIQYLLKPMNCPFAVLMYKTRTRSYRDLPLRWGELGTVYRYERSGVLHGMLRVRGFTQDDAHIFCRPDQLMNEIVGVLDLAFFMLRTFGYEQFDVELSVRDAEHKGKFIGEDSVWENAESALHEALKFRNVAYKVMPGEAKFYGPAIDIKMRDALGRGWQGPTIQVDFNFPERFDLKFVGEDGQDKRPVMVHRTVLGSMERFVGGLIEHYAGAFPVWLAPVQVKVIPIADRHNDYARQVLGKLREAGFRAELDDTADRMNAKVRKAQLEKVPYMLVMGDKEAEAGTVSVRLRSEENLGPRPLDEFIAMAHQAIADKKNV
ncbi:MAG: Threonine--tRNA ligase [Chloroflexi bacterium ADurb.Bin180]|nr:MAG: Threonine--tRNA ligase [Chloroflexi bacterium ADurb.Bin180]HNR95499.1 threonine--tRNA ligase [Anaerolineae bacterium]